MPNHAGGQGEAEYTGKKVIHAYPLREPCGDYATGLGKAGKETKKRLERLNETFLQLGADSRTNINNLTAACGELLDADYTSYQRLEEDCLLSAATWQTPPDYQITTKPDGHICYHVINRGPGKAPLVINNLHQTTYLQTDYRVRAHDLKTYIGCPVCRFGRPVGALGAFYRQETLPDETGILVIKSLAGAMGMEEERLYTSEALERDRAMLSEITANVPDLLCRIDDKGCFTYLSPSHKRILGYTEEDLLHKPVFDFIHPADLTNVVMQSFKFALQNAATGNLELRFKQADGKYCWLECRAKILLDQQGTPSGAVINGRDITSRKKAEEEREKTVTVMEDTMDAMPDLVGIKSPEYKVIYCNEATRAFLGLNREQIHDKKCFELLGRNEPCRLCSTKMVLESKKPERLERHCPEKDRYLDCLSTPILNEKGEISYIVEQFRDVTDRKRSTLYSTTEWDNLQKIVNGMSYYILVVNRKYTVQYLNRAAREGLGDFTGRPCFKQMGYRQPCRECPMQKLFQSDQVQEVPYTLQVRNRIFEGISFRLKNPDGSYSMAAVLTDATDRKQAEEKLKYLSFHDSLTGLYNRAYFEQEMQRLEDGRYAPVGIIVCDVDGLKIANDVLGHKTGDDLLLAASRVIKGVFRGGDVVSRIGGDEFAVLLANSDKTTVENACNRISAAVKKHNSENPDFPLSISTGYAVNDSDPINMKALFKQADDNMYRQKLHHTSGVNMETLLQVVKNRDFSQQSRLQDMVEEIALSLKLQERIIRDLRLLAQFHDIGKVAVSENILKKPSSLTGEEVREIRRHCEIGHRIAQTTPNLVPIADWILKHHEWWNGQGYPLGLQGEQIPLECRILNIADAYDAMTSERPYRKALSHKEAVAELKRCAGTQFDPRLVHEFIKVVGE